MTDAEQAWFHGVAPGDADAGAARIREGFADAPADWPSLAVESGFAADETDYYDRLHAAATAGTRAAVAERERADDQQLVHAIRAIEDLDETINELAERLSEWAGTLFEDAGTGVEYARELVDDEPESTVEERVVALAGRVADLADEREDLRAYVEAHAPAVAPNLSMLAGPMLAARLISHAGGLESLAKQPSGTVQVLGAEDSLFAHLRGHAPSPKHGVIYAHEYVRGTDADRRGAAARTLAGKLSIAARVDHYSGERKPELRDELADRIAQVRSKGGGE
jgi:nucleolar protein 56